MGRTEGRYRSHHLDREMEYIWVGDRGRAVIMLPTSAGRQNENEDFGLVGAVQKKIDAGDIQAELAPLFDRFEWPRSPIAKPR